MPESGCTAVLARSTMPGMPPQLTDTADTAEARAEASGYSARSESEPRVVRTLSMGRVEYAALQLDGARIVVAWRYPQHSNDWRQAGWLVANGKSYTAWTWDRGSMIGISDSIEAGIRAVAEHIRNRWLGVKDD